MEYTITPQYHEKKDCYIYVVRLSDRVNKDDFTSLSELAKSHKGYYSSFRGVNGFVFKTEEQAEQFCEDMMRVFDTNHIPPTTSLSSAPTSDESSAPSIFPSSGMELHKALRAVIQTEGEAIITEVRLVNILDDFKAYSEIPSVKYILRAIVADGYAKKLLAIGEWNSEAIALASRFATTTGFIPELVELIFESLAFGLEWNSESVIPTRRSKNDFYSLHSEVNSHASYKDANKHVVNTGVDSHLKFMGLPICGKVSKFEKILTKKGFTGFCNAPNDFKGPFAGIEDCYVVFNVSSFSNQIWQVKVSLCYSDNFRLNTDRYFQMKKMFSSKYGTPNSNEDILSELSIDGTEWYPFCGGYEGNASPCQSVFCLPNGTITVQLAFHTVEIIYEDNQSRLQHEKASNTSAIQDI